MKQGASLRCLLAIVVAVAFLAPAGPAAAEWYRLGVQRPEVGAEPADFTLPDTRGNTVSLSDFRGKVVLLSFWTCYTDTCFTSVHIIDDLLEEFAGQGFVAPTVCSEIPPALAADNYADLLKRCSAGQVILVDRERVTKGRYHIRRVPTTILIGADFRIRAIVEGVAPLRKDDFKAQVASLIEKAATQKSPPPAAE